MRKVRDWFQRVVLSRLWLTFIVLGLSFLAFGVGTLNLVSMFRSNFLMILDDGWLAVMEGDVSQLAHLLLTGYLSLAAYIVFKACEFRLYRWFTDPPSDPDQ